MSRRGSRGLENQLLRNQVMKIFLMSYKFLDVYLNSNAHHNRRILLGTYLAYILIGICLEFLKHVLY